MPIAPLGIGAYKRSTLPPVILKNLYLEQDKSGVSPDQTLRIERPGLAVEQSFPDRLRAVHPHVTNTGSVRLAVSGNALFAGASNVGSIMGTDQAAVVSTPFAAAIAAGGRGYLYTTTLQTLAFPNDAPRGGTIQDVDQLNGYAVFLLPNGRFYWLVPGETTIDPLNFATAESLPDDAVSVRRLGDELWFFGTQNVEVWQATGDQNAPFQRAAGRNFERGCAYRDTVRRFDNTLVWVGDDNQVYRAVNVPQVISDPGVTECIRKAAGQCSAWTFGTDGHDFYVLRVPGQGSFVYDASTKAWSEFQTLGKGYWEPWVGYQIGGVAYAGSSDSGALWRISADADDAGLPIEVVATATVPIRGPRPRNDSVSVGVSASGNVSIRYRWADGQEAMPPAYEDVTAVAPQDVATLWRLGGAVQPYRTIEVSAVTSERVAIYGMMVNEAWG